MRKLSVIALVIGVLAQRCTSSQLDKTTARRLIKAERSFPKTVSYDVFCGDPVHARRVLDAGLEKTGFVTVDRKQKIIDIGEPLIHFTSKAAPYFLPTSEEDKAIDVQRVKIASEVFAEIRAIKVSSDRKRAIVQYTTMFEDVTPFSVLLRSGIKKEYIHKAYFLYSGGRWRIATKSEMHFLRGGLFNE